MLGILRNHTIPKYLLWKGLALLLAANYFAFRTELFSEEYEQNHPATLTDVVQPSFTLLTLNWETFDKDNAPKAIRVEPFIALQFVRRLPEEPVPQLIYSRQPRSILDKSPPPAPSI